MYYTFFDQVLPIFLALFSGAYISQKMPCRHYLSMPIFEALLCMQVMVNYLRIIFPAGGCINGLIFTTSLHIVYFYACGFEGLVNIVK